MKLDQQLPQEFKQFLADLDRNGRHYPLEFTPQQLTLPKRQPSATAKSDSLSIMLVALHRARLV